VTDDLAAALCAVARRRTLRLTARGRRTGAPRAVTVWFVVEGETIFLATLDARRNWVRNARKTPAVELEIGALRLRGRFAPIVEPALDAHVRALVARKYLAARVGAWLGFQADATFRVDRLERAA